MLYHKKAGTVVRMLNLLKKISFEGLSDQVKCFYCDGGLRNWQPEDDPWVEHSRWFSKCGFIRLVKGDDFIQNCLITKPPDELSEVISRIWYDV
jgi:hypothetical protein